MPVPFWSRGQFGGRSRHQPRCKQFVQQRFDGRCCWGVLCLAQQQIVRDGKNLMMAGRNLSADQLALSSARVSTSAAMMGQAAGIAAAMAAGKTCDPRDLDPADVRRAVIERGAKLDV